MGKKLLRLHDAAEMFGVSTHTIRSWVRKGLVIPRRVPGSRFLWFTREDLLGAAVRPRRGAPALRIVKN
jgi:DNA-binding transcriptional MerR regulator